MSSESGFEWIFLSSTAHKFLGINEFGKVCIYAEPLPVCRFVPCPVSMASSHLIVRLKSAIHKQYTMQIDGPSPFQIDGYGGDSHQSKKSMFRVTCKTKNGEQLTMLESVRWGYYVACRTSGELYINQYTDVRSCFRRFKIAASTPYDLSHTMAALPASIRHNFDQKPQKIVVVPLSSADSAHASAASNMSQQIEGAPNCNDSSGTSHDEKTNEMMDEYATPMNKHSVLIALCTEQALSVSLSGQVVSLVCSAADYRHTFNARFSVIRIPTSSTPGDKSQAVVCIRSIATAQYVSTNHLRRIYFSNEYWNLCAHWIIKLKSQTLDGTKIMVFESCLNHQLLAVEQGSIMLKPTSWKESKNTHFVVRHISDGVPKLSANSKALPSISAASHAQNPINPCASHSQHQLFPAQHQSPPAYNPAAVHSQPYPNHYRYQAQLQQSASLSKASNKFSV